jgi:preprotein translocase subunit SecG
MGGIFAGGSGSAFGSRSGNVLTRASSVLGAVFLVLSLALALLNRGATLTGVEAAGRQAVTTEAGQNTDWWNESAEPQIEIAPEAVPEPSEPSEYKE